MQTDVAWYSDRVEFRASIRAKLLEASGLLAVLLAAGIAVQATGRSSIALPFVIFTAIAFVQQWRRLLIVCRRPVLTVWIERLPNHSQRGISARDLVLIEAADSKGRGIARGNTSPSDWRMAQLYLHIRGEVTPRLAYERFWRDRDRVQAEANQLGAALGVAVKSFETIDC